MEVAERRQLLRASEKPLRATGPEREAASGEPGSIDPAVGENSHRGAERRNVRRFCSQSSMPCMPVESQAGNQRRLNGGCAARLNREGQGLQGSVWKCAISLTAVCAARLSQEAQTLRVGLEGAIRLTAVASPDRTGSLKRYGSVWRVRQACLAHRQLNREA
jgi:hypothetical protein